MSHTVFISHSSKDDHVVRMIVDGLKKFGIECWYDRDALDNDALQGLDYARAIVRAIDTASVFVVVLSESAAESNNVKNEISLAHGRISQGMVLIPFRIMRADIQEELRYYFARTNVIDGRLPPLEERIASFCVLVRDAVAAVMEEPTTPVAQRALIDSLDLPMTNEMRLLAQSVIGELKPQKIAKLIREGRESLDEYYRDNIDPYETYKHYCESTVCDCPLPVLLDELYAQGSYSIAMGELYQFVSYFLINDGKIAYVQKARDFLNKSLTVFERLYNRLPDQAAQIVENIIFSQWLLSITHKQEHNYGLAEQILTGLLTYAEMQRDELDLEFSKSVLLPKRELAIIRADGDAFDELVENIPLYEKDAVEVFYTLRRAFEFYCAEQDFQKATDLKKQLTRAYESCKDELYGVYYYAMMVNIHQYCCHFDLPEEEERVYRELIGHLRENHFARYESRVEKDRRNYLAGRKLRGYGENY